MLREMTAQEKREYEQLVADAKQIELRLEELTGPTVYGYARVSTYGQAASGTSLDDQEQQLKEAGAEVIYKDVFTGTTMERPEFQRLIKSLQKGDTLIITRLDRLGRSVSKASAMITQLLEAGVTINVLNLGILNTSSVSTLTFHILLAFAQFERDLIVERTQEGKMMARQKPGYREGRPRKYSRAQLEHAMDLLEEHSYSQVAEMTGISRATLVRERRRTK